MRQIYKITSIFMMLVLVTTIVGIATAGPAIVKPGPFEYGRGVFIKTDKLMYHQGESVEISITNTLKQPIYFHEIFMEYPPNTIPIACAGDVCTSIGETIRVDPGHRYIYPYTWKPEKGTYRVYIRWTAEDTVTCLVIGGPCPKPESALSGKAISKYFTVR